MQQTTKGCDILLEGGTRRANPQPGSTFSSATYVMLRLVTELDVWMRPVQCCWRSLWIQVTKKQQNISKISYTIHIQLQYYYYITNPRNLNALCVRICQASAKCSIARLADCFQRRPHWHPKPSFWQHHSWRRW